MVRTFPIHLPLFKPIGSPEKLSRCARAPLERVMTDLEKHNRAERSKGGGGKEGWGCGGVWDEIS